MYETVGIALVLISLGALSDEDPLRAVLKDYQAASTQLSEAESSTVVFRQFYSDWKQRLLVLSSASKSSPLYPTAVKELVALCNGLGDYEESLVHCKELLSLKDDPMWVITWTKELGDISHHIYEQKHDRIVLGHAVEYYERVLNLLEQTSDTNARGFRRTWLLPISYRLADYQRSGLGDHLSAARAFSKIRQHLDLDASITDEMATGYTYDAFVTSELLETVRGGDPVMTQSTLDAVVASKRREHDPSFYPLLIASELSELKDGVMGDSRRVEFINLLEKWLAAHAEDPSTLDLIYRVADLLYTKARKFDAALRHYHHLLDHHSDSLIAASAENLKTEKDGIYSEVLYRTGLSAMNMRNNDDAVVHFTKFLEMFSKDDRASYVRDCIDNLKGRNSINAASTSPQVAVRPSHSRLYLLLMANGVAAIGILIWMYASKAKAPPTSSL